ncbi:MAG: hypothetical protein Q8Q90_01580 [bacterium]|nr:hypothetical protein [bacterium]
MKSFFSKRYFLATVVSSLLSVFTVAVVAYGATMTISSTGLGSGTSTPGAAVAAQGAGIFDGFVSANYFTATSSITSWVMGQVGIGTTTPGYQLGVDGAALFGGFVTADYFNATSTVATSTNKFSVEFATSSFKVDGISGRVVIGATTTLPQAGVMGRAFNPDLGLTVTGTGNSATGTVYVAGGGASGGEIIIKSGDGNNCVSMVATTGASDPDTAAQLFANLLTVRVVACPK